MSTTSAAGNLLPEHVRLIKQSQISDEVAQARGYRSITVKAELGRLGFSEPQRIVPCLLLPIYGHDGQIASYQIRPDRPRIDKKRGRPIKYETPAKSSMVLDVPPGAREWLSDPRRPLFITEGARKADSAVSQGLCCIALLGVWNWRGKNSLGGLTALAGWESIALNRNVYIVFDSDVVTKREVRAALHRLTRFLKSRKAAVKIVRLSAGPGGAKVGLDDFLAAGNSVNDLLALAREPDSDTDIKFDDSSTYVATDNGLVFNKPTQDGITEIVLTNFTAEIVTDITIDDGVEQLRTFEIEAKLGGRTKRFDVPAIRFPAMNWAVEKMGASAIIFPGNTLRDHARVAVQMLSKDAARRKRFSHTGWREIDGHRIYLHAGGAIGSGGLLEDVDVAPPEALTRYSLPAPPAGAELVRAIRSSLSFLDLVKIEIAASLLCSIHRSVLGPCDFSIHLSGPTGEGKTAVSAVALQHFGSGLDAQHLPGSWTSTGNALEAIAFAAKDTLLVVDDFVPRGTQTDMSRLHREAERLLRAQANTAGRQRLRPDATLRPTKRPRGLILSTGEDIPRGQSLRARLLILEIGPGDLDWDRLTVLQREASAGFLARAMAGFIQWIACRYDDIVRGLRDEVRRLRDVMFGEDQHKRTAFIVADLAVGMHHFLRFAVDVKALTENEAKALQDRVWAALADANRSQKRYQDEMEPTGRFLELLAAALASGHAHVASRAGCRPDNAGAWGWRQDDGFTETNWRAMGDRIGWVDGDDLYLEPDASFSTAQRIVRDTGESLTVSGKTLHKRLDERRHLVSKDTAQGTLTARRTLEGARRKVLHLRAASLLRRKPDQSDQADPISRSDGQFGWSDSGSDSDQSQEKTDQENRPGHADPPGENDAGVPAGQIGQVSDDIDRRAQENGDDGRERFEV